MIQRLVLISAVFLAGCVSTSPGKMTDADYIIDEIVIDKTVSVVASQFQNGMRFCGFESDGVIFTIVHYGIAQCLPPLASGHIICDIYFGGVSPGYVMGRVDLFPISLGTRAEFRVSRIFSISKAKKIIKSWEEFAFGNAEQICQ